MSYNWFSGWAKAKELRRCRVGRQVYYLRADVEDWASFLALRRQWRRRHGARANRRRTERIDPKAAETFLIPATEAMRLLGVGRGTLFSMARAGVVAVWQGRPGCKGSRCWFSETDIKNVARDEARREQRAKFFKSVGGWRVREPDPDFDWRSQRSRSGPLRVLEKAGRLGEWMTTEQAAIRLGVSRNTVTTLRLRGRLRGERIGRGPRFLKYWYYWPHEVEDLAESEGYRVWRERWARTSGAWGRGKPNPKYAAPLAPHEMEEFGAAKHLTATGFGSCVPEMWERGV